MQVFVHIGGKNYGPYSVEQLRSYVKAGNFKEDQAACYDSKNWVRIREVPGFAVERFKHEVKPRSTAKTVPKKTKKQRIKKLVIVCLSVAVALSVVILSVAWATDFLLEEKMEEGMLSNENLFILTPEQIVEVYDGDTFKINLPQQIPIFGDKLSIRLAGVDTPEMKGTSDEVKALAKQARELTEKALQGADQIELRNPQRGKYFRIVSEVWIDGESLADLLKAKGLAKDYDGEGARPEW